MLSIGFVRENADIVRAAAENKGEAIDVDAILNLDGSRRELLGQVEELRSKRNEASKEIGRIKKDGGVANAKMAEMKGVGDSIKALENDLRGIQEQLDALLLTIPNIPAEGVPVGRDESANRPVKEFGEVRKFDFQPVPHWDIGKKTGTLDFGVASKLSGSGFAFFRGQGARLVRALISFMIDTHTSKHGYTEVFPPFLVSRQTMTGTGQLPKMEDDMYCATEDDLFLIPTAEVPVTNIHRDEVLQEADLPKCYCAYTACFRREAGSYGKDTKGLLRLHQFDKVEMVKFVHPDTSWDELEKLLQDAEAIVQALGLRYRVIELCTGDLSFAAAKCYDIEVYAPGVDRWLEISSCSNFTDFQARRCNIRFRCQGKKTDFVHTLNGSGIALPRTIAAIMECFQQEDRAFEIPEVLRPYMGGARFVE